MAIRGRAVALLALAWLLVGGGSSTAAAAVPETTINSGPSGAVASTAASFTFSSDDPVATFQCALDGAAFTTCASPTSFSSLAQGSHTFQVRATNTSGTDPTPASRTWTVDTVAPDTSIDTGPSGSVASTAATFSFSSNESPVTFQCSVDGAAFTTCATPTSFSGFAQGSHTFQVRARDAAGNLDSTPASRTWTVDTVNPDTSIDSGPSGATSDATPTFTFSSNEGSATFECSLDGAAFSTCASPLTLAAQSEGSHTLQVRARDAAGNIDSSPASRSFIVDTIAPETTITGGPTGLTGDDTPTFTFSSNEGGVSFQCSLDGGGFAACSSPHTLVPQLDGPHTFRVRAIDAAANVDGSPDSRTFILDTGPPETTIDTGPPPAVPTNDPTPAFTFSADEAATFECSVDGSGFSGCVSGAPIAAVADGQHTFTVRAVDSIGNVDASPAARPFAVDTRPPETRIDKAPKPRLKTHRKRAKARFELSADEADATLECSLDGGAFAPCDPSSALSVKAKPGAGKRHSLGVQATDQAGNVDPTPASFSFRAVRLP
jgi:hypothetical protein